MRQPVGLLRDDSRLDRNLLGISAFLANVADTEDLVANTQVSDTIPDCGNDAGEIPSKNVGETRNLTRFALTHLPVREPLTLAATISTTTSPDAATGSGISPN